MLQSLRVAYFVNQYPAVSHSFIRREIRALEKLGLQVSRFAIRMERRGVVDEADQQEALATRHMVDISWRELVAIGFRQLVFNTTRFFGTLAFLVRFTARTDKRPIKALLCLIEACVLWDWTRKQGIQHIHAHFGTNSTTIVLLTAHLGGPGYSFTVHGPEEFDKPEFLGLTNKIEHARFVVAVSSFGRSQLWRWAHPNDWGKIHVIHCGLDHDFLNVAITPVPDVPKLICIGRLCEQKGQLLLIQAVAKLVAEGCPIQLVLVGDGPMRPILERYVAEHDLSSQIQLTGSLSGEAVRREIANARALVLPSFAEGLPVVLMEAFALARPVITTYIAGIPELVTHGVHGWLVPAGSLEDLVDALRQALSTPTGSLFAMGEEGRRRVLERHAIATEARKLAELFTRVIPSPSMAQHQSEEEAAQGG